MQRILVPVDFSTYSVHAFRTACRIASQTQAQVILLHIIHLPFSRNSFNFADIKKRANSRLKKLTKTVDHKIDNEINIHILSGLASPTILQMARKIESSMIIMGRKGISEIENIAVGSVAKDVVLHAKIPVMLVPDQQVNFENERFLFTTGLHPNDAQNFRKSVEFAEDLGADIRVLQISQNISGTDTSLSSQNCASLLQVQNSNRYNKEISIDTVPNEDLLNGIAEYIYNQPASLLILNRYKKSQLSELNHEKSIQTLLENTKISVLVYAGNKS